MDEPVLVTLAFFNSDVDLVMDEDDEAHRIVLGRFATLSGAEWHATTEHVYRHCQEVLAKRDPDELTQELRGIKDPTEVWDFVGPLCVDVRRADDGHIYAILECNCTWNVEDGLQLVFRNGHKLTRVSSYDGNITGRGQVELN